MPRDPEHLRSAVATQILARQTDLAARRAALVGELRDIDLALQDVVAAARVFSVELPTLPVASSPRIDRGARAATVRSTVLEELRLAAPRSLTARHLSEVVRHRLGGERHPKTIGMTLHRLLKQGLARREGFQWSASVAQGIAVRMHGDAPAAPPEGQEPDPTEGRDAP